MLPLKLPALKPRAVAHPLPHLGFEVDAHTRILIVDHSRQVGTTLNFMLTARGFDQSRAVRSPARALIVAGVFQPAIVFLDLELPGTGTLELADELHREGRRRTLRLIAMTSNAEHPSRDPARLSGFERFLVKPVSGEELDQILGVRIASRN